MTEGIEREISAADVVGNVIKMYFLGIEFRSAGRGVVIVYRALTEMLREAHRYLAAGNCVAEQQVGGGIAALASGEPHLKYRGTAVDVCEYKRSAVKEQHCAVGICFDHCLCKLLLHTGQADIYTAVTLSAVGLRLADTKHNGIRFLCGGYCLGKSVGVLIVPKGGAAVCGDYLGIGQLCVYSVSYGNALAVFAVASPETLYLVALGEMTDNSDLFDILGEGKHSVILQQYCGFVCGAPCQCAVLGAEGKLVFALGACSAVRIIEHTKLALQLQHAHYCFVYLLFVYSALAHECAKMLVISV